jgi:hypothetical protein
VPRCTIFGIGLSNPLLPFAISDPNRLIIVVPSDAIAVWSEAELISLMDVVRSALSAYSPSDYFPLAFVDGSTGKIIIPPRRISFDSAIRVLCVYTADGFETVLKRVLWNDERLRI